MLTVITGTIEILADGVKDTAASATITKLIGEAADRGAALTASLLAFARKQPLQPAEIDVNELLDEAAKLLSPTLRQADRNRDRARAPTSGWLSSTAASFPQRSQPRDQRPRRDAGRRQADP